MKLNKNSFSPKFYKWFYETSILPTNFCPYFKKLLLAWVLVALFAVPAMVLLIPTLFIGIFVKDALNMLKKNKFGAILAGFLMYVVLLVLMCIVLFFLVVFGVMQYVEGSDMAELQMLGCFFSLLGFGAGIVYLAKYLGELKRTKVKQPNILSEFIKAKYNKYCPKIDWE